MNPSFQYSPITIQQHILKEQQRFPGASGEFSFLLSGITLATKLIQSKVSRAGLTNLLGSVGIENIQGEVQQKLDVFANEVMIASLSCRESVGILASEENEHISTMPHKSPNAKYAVIFDPLDGSSNIDVNVSVGTTFSIFRRPEGADFNDPMRWVLQPGRRQIAAGYVVYGSSTVMVYTCGNGAHCFTLDPSIGAFVLSHENIKMPEQGNYYSVNEAYRNHFPQPYIDFLERIRNGDLGRNYASRYIGSMVADFHRTLLRGGIFMYPPTKSHPQGKLRLLYEANPVAMIAEQAGGIASTGTARILDIQPESVHERTPLVIGSRVEMEEFQRCMAESVEAA
ncbi:MAG TPA: class 1 fructose-bisphosphatase [Pirellulaceae bacterium]|nr:class 1 fructose-bisphosphatase [Pirellulaceae bacterium]HMO94117.1 class 1 fructose-bisphosphatase [Pirellulaceae bacterium]HMP71044.1 class 1 fructose-bisphosphatase [Pirellulaceae bacterium]